jgi:Uma2 family endonuclease
LIPFRLSGKIEQVTDTITNPQIIIEVLSKSTAEYDRSDKFHAYWTLDSFAEYVLVDQYRVQVEYFRRVSGKQWELQVFTRLDESLSLKSIEVKLPLEQIYQRINWEEVNQDSVDHN